MIKYCKKCKTPFSRVREETCPHNLKENPMSEEEQQRLEAFKKNLKQAARH